MKTVFEAAGGMDGMRRLADAWHKRVLADEVVAHAFSHGFHPDHTERLAAYWAEALGGPTAYTGAYGDETSVVRMHSGNGLHDEMDRRAIACFDQALADVGLTEQDALRQVLHDYFAWATTDTMARYHRSADDVPSGLSILRWSWDGLRGEARRAGVSVGLEGNQASRERRLKSATGGWSRSALSRVRKSGPWGHPAPDCILLRFAYVYWQAYSTERCSQFMKWQRPKHRNLRLGSIGHIFFICWFGFEFIYSWFKHSPHILMHGVFFAIALVVGLAFPSTYFKKK